MMRLEWVPLGERLKCNAGGRLTPRQRLVGRRPPVGLRWLRRDRTKRAGKGVRVAAEPET